MKTAVIIGLRDDKSLAWGIGKALMDKDVQVIFGYQQRNKATVLPLLKECVGFPIEITDSASINRFVEETKKITKKVDFLVHSIAFAKKEHLQGSLLDVNLEGWNLAMHVSAYSLIELIRAFKPLLQESSVLTLTYRGSRQVVKGYHLMGACKAALESEVKYLAEELRPNIRVNALSAPAMPTTAAKAIESFEKLYANEKKISLEQLGKAAVNILFSKKTGEIIQV